MDNLGEGKNQTFKPIGMWQRVQDELRAQVASGIWPPGAMIPGRRALARSMGVNVSTIQRAIAGLVAEGLLIVDDRRGTLVAAKQHSLPSTLHDHVLTPLLSYSGRDIVSRSHAIALHVGVVVTQPRPNQWEKKVVDNVERHLSTHGVIMVQARHFRPTASDELPAGEQAELLIDQGCGALIMVALFEQDANISVQTVLRAIGKKNVPIIFVTDCHIEGPISHVYWSSYDAGYQSAQHMLAKEWKNLGVAGHAQVKWLDERYAGVCAAVRDALGHGHTARAEYIAYTEPDSGEDEMENHIATGVQAGRNLLTGLNRVDGVIAANDFIAIGVMRAAAALDLKVGIDVAVSGFDNIDMASDHGITSVHPPFEEMAEEAAHHAIERQHAGSSPRAVRLQSNLIVRSSTCRITSELLSASRVTGL